MVAVYVEANELSNECVCLLDLERWEDAIKLLYFRLVVTRAKV